MGLTLPHSEINKVSTDLSQVAEPVCGANEVVVEVRATAVNRLDTLQRKGKMQPPPGASAILGLEVSGVVLERGAAVTGVALGDEVMALVPGGAFAPRVAVDARTVMSLSRARSVCSLK